MTYKNGSTLAPRAWISRVDTSGDGMRNGWAATKPVAGRSPVCFAMGDDFRRIFVSAFPTLAGCAPVIQSHGPTPPHSVDSP